MGLLSLGTPMPWEESRAYCDHVRQHGIRQFLSIWTRLRSRRKDHLLWGDELEYVVVQLDPEARTARLSLQADQALALLSEREQERRRLQTDAATSIVTNATTTTTDSGVPGADAATAVGTSPSGPESSWHPEYGCYMIEGTPGAPYGARLKDLLSVYPSMVARRKEGQSALPEHTHLFSLTNFPLLGRVPFLNDATLLPTPEAGAARSLFIPDDAIARHARFPTLTANIRKRRGSKVVINVPIFKDVHTPSPFREPCPPHLPPSFQGKTIPDVEPEALPDHIYMDAMCFGMGCCCLQVTFQACSVQEARRLYDQLAPVTPIMLALSAGSPIYRGYLAEVDCRWNVISASVDDRTPEERGLLPLEASQSRFRIRKSRYDSISCYLSPGPDYSEGGCNVPLVLGEERAEEEPMSPHQYPARKSHFDPAYNDIQPAVDHDIYQQLLTGGVDEDLARHYAHLFIRDPLVVYRETLEQDEVGSSDHFENIQSTNWQTMRFKPPPPTSPNMGWRVEFRSMEIQLTDLENAAFSIFVVLLTRTILAFDLNFYLPLSKVDENMQRAQRRDAVSRERFWFRTRIFGNPDYLPQPLSAFPFPIDVGSEAEELSVQEILNGKADGTFPGLVPLIKAYLSYKPRATSFCIPCAGSSSLTEAEHSELCTYLDLLQHKASGALPTGAAWIRRFVQAHPAYRQDSVVPDAVVYDLMQVLRAMGEAEGGKVQGLNTL